MGVRPSKSKDWVYDSNGFQACEVCGESAVGKPAVLLSHYEVFDGENGSRLRFFYRTDENGRELPPSQEQGEHPNGPMVHLAGCLEMFLWGEVAVTLQETRRRASE